MISIIKLKFTHGIWILEYEKECSNIECLAMSYLRVGEVQTMDFMG